VAEQLIPVFSSLSVAIASRIVDEVVRLRAAHNILPLAVAVLDAGGQLVCFRRDDGCGVLRHDVALGKAWGALGMGMSTRQIRDRLAQRPSFQAALAAASDGRFIPTPGGVLIVNAQGQAIGAVGISGDASDKDEFCAIEAIRAAGLTPEPPAPAANWQGAGL
jgi:glc operon protein GlcG